MKKVDRQQERIVELQRQLSLARNVLTKIATGHSRNPSIDADEALTEMWPLDQKQPLQNIVGHGHG